MNVRESARAIVLTADRKVLLFQCSDQTPVDPRQPHVTDYWVTPGGGREPGETLEQTLERELIEEAGMHVVVGPMVALRSRPLWLQGQIVQSSEHYFVAHPVSVAVDHGRMTHYERQSFVRSKWWPVDSLLQSKDLPVVPSGLVELISQLCDGLVPTEPVILDQ